MGNPFLLQACLRLNNDEIPHPLILGKEYIFSKEGHRLYPLNVPMDLRSNDWSFFGRIIISEFRVGRNKTERKFILVKEFSQDEKEIITKAYVSDEEVAKVLRDYR